MSVAQRVVPGAGEAELPLGNGVPADPLSPVAGLWPVRAPSLVAPVPVSPPAPTLWVEGPASPRPLTCPAPESLLALSSARAMPVTPARIAVANRGARRSAFIVPPTVSLAAHNGALPDQQSLPNGRSGCGAQEAIEPSLWFSRAEHAEDMLLKALHNARLRTALHQQDRPAFRSAILNFEQPFLTGLSVRFTVEYPAPLSYAACAGVASGRHASGRAYLDAFDL